MKLLLAFSAAAQAYPTQWIVPQSTLPKDLPSQQLEQLVDSFEFVWELDELSFQERVDAVSKILFRK